jgi:hypothetical protein
VRENESGARAGVGATEAFGRHAVDDHAVHGGVEQRGEGAVGGEDKARAPDRAGEVGRREEEQEDEDGACQRRHDPDTPPAHAEVAVPVHHRPPGRLQHPGQPDRHRVPRHFGGGSAQPGMVVGQGGEGEAGDQPLVGV